MLGNISTNAPSLEYQIKPDDKVFYLHIPKTAGNTLTNILDANFDNDEIFHSHLLDSLINLSPESLAYYRFFRGHFPYAVVDNLLHSKLVRLTMLRDPVERVISQFAHIQRASPQAMPVHSLVTDELRNAHQLSLTDFANSSSPLLYRIINNYQVAMMVAPFDSQAWNVVDAMPYANVKATEFLDMDLARQRLADFEFIGLVERFQESLFLLAYTFGWRPAPANQRLNVSRNKPQHEKIPQSTLDQLTRANALDAELYGCAQQIFDSRYARMTQDLLEKYGTATMAQAKGPLALEAVRELLEKHYETRYRHTHQGTDRLHLDLDKAMSGSQWQRVQSHPKYGTYRWTGPGLVSDLDLALQADSDLAIAIRVLAAVDTETLESLSLTANGQPIALTRRRDSVGAYIYMGIIPASIVANGRGFTRISLHVKKTLELAKTRFTPSIQSLVMRLNEFLTPETNRFKLLILKIYRTLIGQNIWFILEDDRALGLAVSWVDIRPAE